MLINIPDDLYEDIQKLIKDKSAKNNKSVKFDIDTLISKDKSNLTKENDSEYWGEEVTVKRNWKSSPSHPETFLAYITPAEAKLLRSLGLGYSLINGKYQQHFDKDGIPSFNGWGAGDSDYGGGQQSSEDAAGTSATGSTGSNGRTGAENAAAAEAAAAAGEAAKAEAERIAAEEKAAREAIIDAEIDEYQADQELRDLSDGAYSLYDPKATYKYDEPSKTVYDTTATSSWSVSYDKDGISEVSASTNDPYGDYDNGLSSSYKDSWYGNSISTIGYSTETGLAGDVSVAKEFNLEFTVGGISFDASAFGDVSINGYSLGLFGAIGYKVAGVKAAQIAETLSLGVSFYTGFQAFQMGMGLASFGLKGVGLVASISGVYGMYSSMVAASALYGATRTMSNTLASRGSYGDGNTDANFLIAVAEAQAEVEAIASSNLEFYTDLASGTIFDKMAGGLLYDVKLAGNSYYDASSINNPKVSVGAGLNISKHSLRINNPYKDFEFPKLAGSDNWSVLN